MWLFRIFVCCSLFRSFSLRFLTFAIIVVFFIRFFGFWYFYELYEEFESVYETFAVVPFSLDYRFLRFAQIHIGFEQILFAQFILNDFFTHVYHILI